MPRRHFEPEYRRRIREKAEKQKAETNKENWEAANNARVGDLAAAIHRVEQKFDSEKSNNSPQKRSDRCWERAGVVGILAAAAAGVAAIIVGNNDSAHQLSEMRTEQRPWVYAEEVEPSGPANFDGYNFTFGLRYRLKNVGRMTATNVNVYAVSYLSGIKGGNARAQDDWEGITEGTLRSLNGGKSDIPFTAVIAKFCDNLETIDTLKQKVQSLKEQAKGHHPGFSFYLPGTALFPDVVDDAHTVDVEPIDSTKVSVAEPYLPIVQLCIRYSDSAGKPIGSTQEFFVGYLADPRRPDEETPFDPRAKSVPVENIRLRRSDRFSQ
jgi:hypothetical protein